MKNRQRELRFTRSSVGLDDGPKNNIIYIDDGEVMETGFISGVPNGVPSYNNGVDTYMDEN